ncbi:MAG TPA: alpha-hydroxy acid oxidase, partial [Gammaproteobacteria bacterium]|nr:alpha-hydroxy acid oxidase [Gammaproteobacteria bacterium]
MRKGIERCFNIAELRKRAKRKMPAPMFHYIDGGADDEWTLRRNTEAFDSVEFMPRVLVDTTGIETATQVFGQQIEWPFFLSPTALSRLFHHQGETAVASAAHDAGTLYSLSSFSSMRIEDVGQLTPGPKAFQVYVLKDRGLSREFLQRAREAGFCALQLTVDVPGVSGNRERDIVTG